MVLVVEDEPMVAGLTCRMVVDAGYRCEWVRTGREAMALVKTGALAVDLVILDMVLPDMLGTKVADSIRERQPGMPILFTSAYLEHQGDPPTLAGSAFLPKPYSAQEKAVALHRLLPTLASSQGEPLAGIKHSG